MCFVFRDGPGCLQFKLGRSELCQPVQTEWQGPLKLFSSTIWESVPPSSSDGRASQRTPDIYAFEVGDQAVDGLHYHVIAGRHASDPLSGQNCPGLSRVGVQWVANIGWQRQILLRRPLHSRCVKIEAFRQHGDKIDVIGPIKID